MSASTRILGMMSGSSLDGLDLAVCEFSGTYPDLQWKIIQAETLPYPEDWKVRLRQAAQLTGLDLHHLDADYGKWLGGIVCEWLEKNRLKADLIASHGHTVFHEPLLGFSTQIGNGAHIAAITKINTVSQFRVADIAMGGQGAPLAPVADLHLFSGYSGYLNLGGIANITLLNKNGQWQAWDICPCNQVLNHLAGMMGLSYDPAGINATKGVVIEALVNRLKHDYPSRSGEPFSLSNASVQTGWISYLNEQSYTMPDLLASVSWAIATILMDHISDVTAGQQRIMVSGGGVRNQHLMELLHKQGHQQSISFHIPSDLVIDFKESLLIAYLGYLHLAQIAFPIHQLTGARHDNVGGLLYRAPA